jgi:hypothetical protein
VKLLVTSLAVLSLAGGAVAGVAGTAGADHAGASTAGSFSGRAEVNNDATNNRILGDPNGRGTARVYSPGGGIVCYEISVSKIAPATAAHIHEAPAGRSGPVVVTLEAPTDGSSEGCIDTEDAVLAAEITSTDPANYYVNVHNAEYPSGAVRAQLGG